MHRTSEKQHKAVLEDLENKIIVIKKYYDYYLENKDRF